MISRVCVFIRYLPVPCFSFVSFTMHLGTQLLFYTLNVFRWVSKVCNHERIFGFVVFFFIMSIMDGFVRSVCSTLKRNAVCRTRYMKERKHALFVTLEPKRRFFFPPVVCLLLDLCVRYCKASLSAWPCCVGNKTRHGLGFYSIYTTSVSNLFRRPASRFRVFFFFAFVEIQIPCYRRAQEKTVSCESSCMLL